MQAMKLEERRNEKKTAFVVTAGDEPHSPEPLSAENSLWMLTFQPHLGSHTYCINQRCMSPYLK
jgi:hypothetical protein